MWLLQLRPTGRHLIIYVRFLMERVQLIFETQFLNAVVNRLSPSILQINDLHSARIRAASVRVQHKISQSQHPLQIIKLVEVWTCKTHPVLQPNGPHLKPHTEPIPTTYSERHLSQDLCNSRFIQSPSLQHYYTYAKVMIIKLNATPRYRTWSPVFT